jgi:hypothetical protein
MAVSSPPYVRVNLFHIQFLNEQILCAGTFTAAHTDDDTDKRILVILPFFFANVKMTEEPSKTAR